jgi:excisionase family DNA binding protein
MLECESSAATLHVHTHAHQGDMVKSILTASDVAAYCHVTSTTVTRWIKRGYLQAHTTPGGHFRVLRNDFRAFLERNRMPIDETLFSEAKSA